ncbi:MAG TPA: hypothetical protein VHT05_00115 [Candidatus Elarobacter sp.]|jgi:hypothetical protein|nr:hypothetical protein [Candidatus Elarobacter sp.]
MHRLSTSFVLGYHGCDRRTGEQLLAGHEFKPSNNDFDWLGPGIYFWESNWARGLEFAGEQMTRMSSKVEVPFVVGAVIELGSCLDLTTKAGIDLVRTAHRVLQNDFGASGMTLPYNDRGRRKHYLDCAVLKRVHSLAIGSAEIGPIQTVKGVFVEGGPAFPGSEFFAKTHTQIAVCDPACIKAVFRVRELSRAA